MKSESFGPYWDLPRRVGKIFELAVGSPTAPREELRRKGWGVRNPLGPSRDPWTYQRYIRRSKAEFSIAKHGYVVSRSGWFSERTTGYLASGRPAVVQDTGFTGRLPSGRGLFAFSSPEEAEAGIAAVNRDYELHCRNARRLVEEHFDARVVLARLIDQALEPHSSRVSVR